MSVFNLDFNAYSLIKFFSSLVLNTLLSTMSRFALSSVLVCILGLLLFASPANATISMPLPPGGSVEFSLSNGNVQIVNLSQASGDAYANNLIDPNLVNMNVIGSPYPQPFQIIDTNLIEISVNTIPIGQRRVNVRFRYTDRQLQRLGIRESSLHVLKKGPNIFEPSGPEVWRPLPLDYQINRLRVSTRYLRDLPRMLRVGDFGIDRRINRVFASFPSNGVYALAGVVPEPAAWSLIFLGGMLLLGVHRRKSKQSRI